MLKFDSATDEKPEAVDAPSARLERLWSARACIDLSVEGIGRWQIRDIDTMRSLFALLERLESIAQIRAGFDSISRGEGIPLESASRLSGRNMGFRIELNLRESRG